jgi:uncharacterized protein (TIGR04255 family)
MSIKEVYNNPTAKQVVFQVTFPNFFLMENKIGDLQLKIMQKFPVSNLLIQRQFLVAQTVNKNPLAEIESQAATKKIWQFKSQEEDVQLDISVDSLSLLSMKHKTYNNEGSANKFRDTISFVMKEFLEIVPLFRISRIGLRYLDECPLPEELTKESFSSYYNSFINFSNIENITNADLLEFSSVTHHGEMIVRYKESLKKDNNVTKYSLDFDGQMLNIPQTEYLEKLDIIHEKIADWYESIIKEPVKKIMRQ